MSIHTKCVSELIYNFIPPFKIPKSRQMHAQVPNPSVLLSISDLPCIAKLFVARLLTNSSHNILYCSAFHLSTHANLFSISFASSRLHRPSFPRNNSSCSRNQFLSGLPSEAQPPTKRIQNSSSGFKKSGSFIREHSKSRLSHVTTESKSELLT